jgi:hypothetical protein
VFVRDVELVEPPERIVRFLVRFGFLDEVHRDSRRSLYLSNVAGFKSVGALGDGEAGVFGDAFTLSTDHLANEQVESGAQIVNAVLGDGAPVERRVIRYFGLVDQISRIGIVVSDSFVGVGFSKPLVSGLEVTEVMFGPFDLYPNPGEIGLAGHDQYNKGIMVSKRSKLP